MTRARKATAIGRATGSLLVGSDTLGADALVLRFDAVQQDRNERVQDDIHRGELVWALAGVDVDAAAGVFRSAHDSVTGVTETVWSDEDESGDAPSDATFTELRNADVDGVEP